MSDNVNGRMPDEIKKGLECCLECCKYDNGCPYMAHVDCCNDLRSDALSYIQQLERERDALLADLKEADHVDCSHCKSYILAESNDCEYADFLCDDCEVKECGCRNCKDGSNWQWRGVEVE